MNDFLHHSLAGILNLYALFSPYPRPARMHHLRRHLCRQAFQYYVGIRVNERLLIDLDPPVRVPEHDLFPLETYRHALANAVTYLSSFFAQGGA